jgi:nitrous oxide reductase accessory protein NosL
VAFRTREQAEAYFAEHGGRVLNYELALQSVKEW